MTNSHFPHVRLNPHEEELIGSREHPDGASHACTKGGAFACALSAAVGAIRHRNQSATSEGGELLGTRSAAPSGISPRPRADYHHEQEAIAIDGLHPAMA